MATPAAILAIEVKANTAAATAGLSKVEAEGRAAAATQGTLAKSSGRASGAMKKLGTAAKWGGAALGVAFVVEAKKAVTTTQDLTKSTISLHKNLGLSNKQASEWAGLAKARGADSKQLGMAFKTMATQLSGAAHGSQASIDMFKELGFSQKDIKKGMTDTQFAIKKTADGLNALPAGADKATFASKLFGRGWQTIAPILRDGSAAMQEQLDTVEKYGGVLQGKTLKQQEALLANIRENKIAWQGFQVTLASAVTPALNTVSDQFQRIAKINADKNLTPDEKFQKIAKIIRNDLSKALDFFLKQIPKIANEVGRQAPKIAIALVKGFMQADVWGKLALGAWFIHKTGLGSAMMARWGKKGGKSFGKAYAIGLVLALPLLIPLAFKLGEKLGKAVAQPVHTAIRDVINFIADKLNWVIGRINDIIGIANKIPGVDIGELGSLGQIMSPGEKKRSRKRAQRANRLSNFGAPGPIHGATGGLVPKMFARGGRVGTDTVPAMLTPGEFVIKKAAVDKIGASALSAMNEGKVKKDTKGLSLEGQVGKKLAKDARKAAKDTATGVNDEFTKGHKIATEGTKDFTKMHGDQMQKLQKDASTQTTKFRKNTDDDFDKTNKNSTQTTNRMRGNVTQGFQQMGKQSTKATGKMQKGVGHDYGSMAQAGIKGIQILGKATNKALTALGVKKIDFGAKTDKPGKHQKGGVIVPGQGSGDKVPAMLEPGEVVLNRKAVAAAGERNLLSFNRQHARFQRGGLVGMAGGGSVTGDTHGLKPAFMSALEAMSAGTHRGISVTSGYRSYAEQVALYNAYLAGTGNLAAKPGTSHHELGIAADISPGREVFGGAAGKYGLGFTVPSESWHIELLNAAAAGKFGPKAQKIARVLLTGPDGPLKSMGQAALDKVRGAMNKKIAASQPSGGIGSFGSIKAGSVQELAHKMVLAAWGASQWGPFQSLEMGEAGWNVHAQNPNSTAYGLAQNINPSTYPPAGRPGSTAPIIEQARAQLAWMINYIKGRYGDPAKAWAFWQAQSPHYYAKGGKVGMKGGGKATDGPKKIIRGKVSWFTPKEGAYGFGPGPGIALNPNPPGGWDTPEVRSWAGKFFRVHIGDHSAFLPVIDKGPAIDSRKIDVTKQGVKKLGMSLGSFPTDSIGTATGPFKKAGHGHHGGHGGDGGSHSHTKAEKVTGKDVKAGLNSLSVKGLFQLMKVLTKGPGSGHEGLRDKVREMLLKNIADVRKGTPVKDKGHLHDYLNELDVLMLKLKLHKKGKPHKRSVDDLDDWLADPEDGFYTWQTLRNRKREWKRLKLLKQIAAKTPGKKDDERIAALIEKFTGKKPGKGGEVDQDAAARTQQLFDFLKLLGPVTSLSTFGTGGKLGAGRFGIAGESGPELIRGPATISSPQETASMLSPSFDVRVFIGGRELTDIVDVQIDRKDRAKDLKRRTGVSPAR